MKKILFFVLLLPSASYAVTLSIDIPNPIAARVVDDIARRHNYQANIPDVNNPGQTIPNPETQAQFVVRIYKTLIRSEAMAQEKEDQRAAQEQTIASQIIIP